MFDLVSNIDIVVLLKESGSFRNNSILYSAIKSRLVPTVLSDENDKALKAFCAKYCIIYKGDGELIHPPLK